MLILIDNYDSFTYNVYHYLSELNADIKIYRNDKVSIDDLKKLKPKGFIKLTGMPELADNRIIAPTFPAISG